MPNNNETILYDWIYSLEDRSEVPPCLAINIHTYCNAKCDMCTRTYEKEKLKRGLMEWNFYINIINQYKSIGGQAITYCQHGDTFAHPKAPDYIEYAITQGLKCYIVTNASNLTPQVVDRLVSIGFKGPLVISFHEWV